MFEAHHAVIHRFLRRMTGDAATADDLTQDVFVRVMRGMETYDARERDLAWLFRIARRLVLDGHRSARRGLVLVDVAADAAARSSPPHLGVALDQALSALDDIDRESFLLREVGGLGYDEIAAVTGGTRGAVRNRIHRARMALRAILAPRLHAPHGPAQEATS
jgi:RNA polymerase sigma-70 factor (ECF subfamily)